VRHGNNGNGALHCESYEIRTSGECEKSAEILESIMTANA
jgi:hypothetical protein